MRIVASLAAFALAAALPAAAQQSQPLDVPKGKPFKHRNSGIELPATLGGYALGNAYQSAPDQLDVAFNFVGGNQDEIISIYIYRLVSGGVPVWFDVARQTLEGRGDGAYGGLKPIGGDHSFTPPGQSTASGLALAYDIGKGDFKSTGVAIMPMDEWLVKVRYSSSTLDAAALVPRMQAALAALKWPRTIPAAAPAIEVTPCTDTLRFDGTSKDAAQEKGAGIMDALIATAANQKVKAKKGPPPTPVRWCRDSSPSPMGTAYRANGSTDSYLLAISDAGRAVHVSPGQGAVLLAAISEKEGEAPAKAWTVRFIELHQTINFPAQDRLPSPERTIEIASEGSYISIASTWGKDRKITVNSDNFK